MQIFMTLRCSDAHLENE